MDANLYNRGRDIILRMRGSLNALPDTAAQDAENWARNFSEAVVRRSITFSVFVIDITSLHRLGRIGVHRARRA